MAGQEPSDWFQRTLPVRWDETRVEQEHARQGTVVRAYQPNGFDVWQMNGNVWEWCRSPYEETLDAAISAIEETDINTSSGLRVLRGGSWSSLARSSRSADRGRDTPGGRSQYNGFRVVRFLRTQ